jgi:DNA-binding response OmpR family regulator
MKNKVLVIEDDSFIRDSLKELLESEGFAVECAEDGQKGIDLLRKAETLPNLILLDLMMPVKDGFAFRQEQISDPDFASIPVVVMTADSQIESKGMEIGAKNYIKKPVDIDNVVEVVKRSCR